MGDTSEIQQAADPMQQWMGHMGNWTNPDAPEHISMNVVGRPPSPVDMDAYEYLPATQLPPLPGDPPPDAFEPVAHDDAPAVDATDASPPGPDAAQQATDEAMALAKDSRRSKRIKVIKPKEAQKVEEALAAEQDEHLVPVAVPPELAEGEMEHVWDASNPPPPVPLYPEEMQQDLVRAHQEYSMYNAPPTMLSAATIYAHQAQVERNTLEMFAEQTRQVLESVNPDVDPYTYEAARLMEITRLEAEAKWNSAARRYYAKKRKAIEEKLRYTEEERKLQGKVVTMVTKKDVAKLPGTTGTTTTKVEAKKKAKKKVEKEEPKSISAREEMMKTTQSTSKRPRRRYSPDRYDRPERKSYRHRTLPNRRHSSWSEDSDEEDDDDSGAAPIKRKSGVAGR
eukprot:Sspe_Gene.84743::Locus_55632_Transcript_1_1_Confidence_1.000_Length_1344::g.84743::m.84743